MYSLEKRDSNLDYSKRQILLVQENYKVFVPILLLLAVGLLALNIANALHNFMAVYICVAVNLVGVGFCCYVLLTLIKGNIRQRNLFALLEEKTGLPENAQALRYVSDTDDVLKQANIAWLCETESAYVLVPQLPKYKHLPFTRYDFREDFGRLTLPKGEYDVVKEGSSVCFISAQNEFKFESVQ